jgi:nucleotidyltransferase/DNA polymerase involved in DNA repair
MATPHRYGCLVIPHLPVRLALREHPGLAGLPLAIGTPGQRGTLTDCSPEARRLGLRPGMLAREAQSLAPQLVVLPADPLAYAQAHAELLHALYQRCPTLQSGPLGCIYLDLRGLERHYAGPEALGTALLEGVDATLGPRMGIASGKFAAYLAGRRARPGMVRVLDGEALERLLARCPVELLPIEPATLRRLEQLGLQRLGDLARLPLTAVLAQFGAEGQRAWQLARGEDPDPFVVEPVLEPIIELLRLPAPTSLEGDLAVALRIVIGRLLARAELRGRALRRLRLDLRLESGSSTGRAVLVKDGTRDVRRLTTLLRSQLGALPLDAPVAALQLEALAFGEQAPQQTMLGDELRRPVNRLRGAVAELAQRYGASPLYQVVEVNRWARLPEHRWALATYEP